MFTQIFRNWWLYAVRGALAIAFGILALIWPGQTLVVLFVLFGLFALADGIFALVTGFTASRYNDRWWALSLEGAVEILIGLLMLLQPQISAKVLVYLIGVWAVLTGILGIAAAVHFWKVVREWALVVGGVLSIVLGVLLFAFPEAGAVALVWLIAAYAILHGFVLIIEAFRLRGLRNEFKAADQAIHDAGQLLEWWMRF